MWCHYFAIPVVMEADTGYTLGYNVSADMEYASKRLKQLKEQYQHHVCGGGKIEISILNGNPQTELKKYIEQYQMDLLIKGLSKFNLLAPHLVNSFYQQAGTQNQYTGACRTLERIGMSFQKNSIACS